jgi:hypothetical protein
MLFKAMLNEQHHVFGTTSLLPDIPRTKLC